MLSSPNPISTDEHAPDLQPDVAFFGNYNLVWGGGFVQHNVVVNGAKGTLAQAHFNLLTNH